MKCMHYIALFSLVAAIGCAEQGTLRQPEVDRVAFEESVYPILLRDCGFPACHGSPDRFFRVFGPGRVRLDAATRLGGPADPAEVDQSFERARSMVEAVEVASRSLLIRKPLEVGAGGAGHEGIDRFGRDVYGSMDSPNLQQLLRWARGEPPSVQVGMPRLRTRVRKMGERTRGWHRDPGRVEMGALRCRGRLFRRPCASVSEGSSLR